MIDTRRWVLCEAWLSLGLRFEWAGAYEATQLPREEWQEDDGVRHAYFYAGAGVWKVHQPSDVGYRPADLPKLTAPMIGTDSMRHELAHWLASSSEQRAERNFGIGGGAEADARERRALDAEATIDAMMGACDRILGQAIAGRRR